MTTTEIRIREVEASEVKTIKAKMIKCGGLDMTSNVFPNMEISNVCRKAGELFAIDQNFVNAIRYFFDNGYRVDLDYRPEYEDSWPYASNDFRGTIHKREVKIIDGKEVMVCTPFPLRVYPEGPVSAFKDSYVIKISFRYKDNYENAMRAFYHETKWGLIVMKIPRGERVPKSELSNINPNTEYRKLKLKSLAEKFNQSSVSKDIKQKYNIQ